jgi:hypothetical protein
MSATVLALGTPAVQSAALFQIVFAPPVHVDVVRPIACP